MLFDREYALKQNTIFSTCFCICTILKIKKILYYFKTISDTNCKTGETAMSNCLFFHLSKNIIADRMYNKNKRLIISSEISLETGKEHWCAIHYSIIFYINKNY